VRRAIYTAGLGGSELDEVVPELAAQLDICKVRFVARSRAGGGE